jgi:hypothetical protein
LPGKALLWRRRRGTRVKPFGFEAARHEK